MRDERQCKRRDENPNRIDNGGPRERRTRQFEHYLGLTEFRTRRLVKSDCFLIFSIPVPRNIRARLEGSARRGVQFAFMDQGCYLDLPDTTLLPE